MYTNCYCTHVEAQICLVHCNAIFLTSTSSNHTKKLLLLWSAVQQSNKWCGDSCAYTMLPPKFNTLTTCRVSTCTFSSSCTDCRPGPCIVLFQARLSMLDDAAGWYASAMGHPNPANSICRGIVLARLHLQPCSGYVMHCRVASVHVNFWMFIIRSMEWARLLAECCENASEIHLHTS